MAMWTVGLINRDPEVRAGLVACVVEAARARWGAQEAAASWELLGDVAGRASSSAHRAVVDREDAWLEKLVGRRSALRADDAREGHPRRQRDLPRWTPPKSWTGLGALGPNTQRDLGASTFCALGDGVTCALLDGGDGFLGVGDVLRMAPLVDVVVLALDGSESGAGWVESQSIEAALAQGAARWVVVVEGRAKAPALAELGLEVLAEAEGVEVQVVTARGALLGAVSAGRAAAVERVDDQETQPLRWVLTGAAAPERGARRVWGRVLSGGFGVGDTVEVALLRGAERGMCLCEGRVAALWVGDRVGDVAGPGDWVVCLLEGLGREPLAVPSLVTVPGGRQKRDMAVRAQVLVRAMRYGESPSEVDALCWTVEGPNRCVWRPVDPPEDAGPDDEAWALELARGAALVPGQPVAISQLGHLVAAGEVLSAGGMALEWPWYQGDGGEVLGHMRHLLHQPDPSAAMDQALAFLSRFRVRPSRAEALQALAVAARDYLVQHALARVRREAAPAPAGLWRLASAQGRALTWEGMSGLMLEVRPERVRPLNLTLCPVALPDIDAMRFDAHVRVLGTEHWLKLRKRLPEAPSDAGDADDASAEIFQFWGRFGCQDRLCWTGPETFTRWISRPRQGAPEALELVYRPLR